MITLLSKIFKLNQLPEEKQRGLLGKICGVTGIVLNLCLFAIKFFAGIVAGSISITADAFNNLSDAGSSITTIAGFKLAEQKPDSEHPYGHGRIEYIAGILVSVIIMLMAYDLFKSSIAKIINPEPIVFSPVVVVILLISIAVKCYMSYYNSASAKKINSPVLKATASDSLSDCFATSVVLISTLIFHFTGYNLDGIAGLVVSVMVFLAGVGSIKDSINPLLGQEPDPEFVKAISEYAVAFNDNILGVHDLLVHDYGPSRCIISLHAEVPADGNILELHDIIDNLEYYLGVNFKCMATIHMDPIVINDPTTNSLREKISQLATEINDKITVHDFRMVPGDTHTNLIFDMVVPYSINLSDHDAKVLMYQKIKDNIGETYFPVIQIDH